MWLKSLDKNNQIILKKVATQVGVSTSAVRTWVRGVVPKEQYWNAIATSLNMDRARVRELYMAQLDQEGRLANCIICGTPIIKWVKSTKLCADSNCHKTHDIQRKRKARAKIKSTASVNPFRCFEFGSNYKLETPQQKMELRKKIKLETENYLNSGKQIKVLEPGNAVNSDAFSLALMSEGLDDLINDEY